MNAKKTRAAMTAGALALALAVTGCSMNVSDKPEDAASSAQETAAADSSSTEGDQGGQNGAAEGTKESGDAPAASDGGGEASDSAGTSSPDSGNASGNGSDVAQQYGVDPNNPGPVLGEGRSAIQWDDGDKATMVTKLHSLKRDGTTVVAVFSFTPTVEGGSEETQPLYWVLGNSGPWEPALIDTKNLNRHGPLKLDENDTDGGYMRSNARQVELADGQTTYAYAVFAAPPEDVTSMDVIMGDGMPALKNVPVE